MQPTELKALILASGLSNSEFARRVPISYRNLTRMLAGTAPILPRTAASISRMFGAGEAAPSEWPRDEWIVGEGPPPDRREYLIHTAPPRFIARVVALDVITDEPEPDEDPVGLAGVVYDSGDSRLCKFVWIDPAPTDPTALTRLVDRAADQLDWD